MSRRHFNGIFDTAHPLASGKTVAKEGVKNLLAETIGGKYAMHAGNTVLREVTLRDGRCALEFIRCNPHFGGVSSCDTADGLGQRPYTEVSSTSSRNAGESASCTPISARSVTAKGLCAGETVVALQNLAERVRERPHPPHDDPQASGFHEYDEEPIDFLRHGRVTGPSVFVEGAERGEECDREGG